jgi:hypothetical protein
MKLLQTFAAAYLAAQYAIAASIGGKPGVLIRGPEDPEKRAALQSIVSTIDLIAVRYRLFSKVRQVTWDKYSLSVNGERIMIYSGEFHPYRYFSKERSKPNLDD